MRNQNPTKLADANQAEQRNITGGCIHCAVDIWVNHGCPNDFKAEPDFQTEGGFGSDFGGVRVHGE